MAQAARRVEEDRPGYSGRLLLRMPPELHAELARQAEREHVSLNHLITGAVAAAVGWPTGDEGARELDVGRADRGSRIVSPRAIGAALILNLVVLTVAGAAAIALLVLAWTRL